MARITYVLAEPALSGGVKVVFEHAAMLRRVGHDVLVVGQGGPPGWIDTEVSYRDLQVAPIPANADLLIATYWTTIDLVRRTPARRRAHFCQGFEGQFPHLLGQRASINQAYAVDWPTLIVSPHLERTLAQFHRRGFYLTPPAALTRPRGSAANRSAKPRVHIPGIFECTWKGVPTALRAARLLNQQILIDLVRVSLLPISRKEAMEFGESEAHVGITPKASLRVLNSCDLALFASEEAEGFGLPLLEAMANGVPVVGTAIPSAKFMTGKESIVLVPPGDSQAMAKRAHALLASSDEREAAIQAGYRAALRFSPDSVEKDLAEAVKQILSAA